jgi:serine/threonine protein phosphatase 1
VVCGHTAQRTGSIADLGHTICIDTAIAYGGWLTCLDLENFAVYQTAQDGSHRSGRLVR